MQTEDPTKPTNLTRTNLSRSVLTPLTVGDRSQPSETDSSGSSGRFYLEKPKPPNPPNKNSKKAENYLDLATMQCSSAPIRPRLAFTQIDSNLAKVYSLPHSYMLKSGDIWLDLAKIYSNSAKTPVSLTLTPLILGDLGQISIDSKEYWPNLVRFGQISAKLRQYQKTQNRPIHTRKLIQPDPVDLKFHLGWLLVEIFPTR